MKSSRDIPPRVGMQVNFIGADIAITSLGRDGFEGIVIANIPNAYGQPRDRWVGGLSNWNNGQYEITWIPPTDDERRLFMEAARYQRAQVCAVVHRCNVTCKFLGACGGGYSFNKRAEIAESLALDGADYDDMPDFEELER